MAESSTGQDEASDATAVTTADGLPAWRFLRDFAAQMPETTELILLDDDIPPGNVFLKDMAPVADVRQFPGPARDQLPGWIRNRAGQFGLELSPRAASTIAERVGPDLWSLSNELEKLALLAATGPPPTEETLLSFLSASREQSVFMLCDQIVEGRRGQALSGLRRLLAEEQSPQYLLSMITRHFRLLTLARDGLDARATPVQIMERLETRSQFVVDKTTRQARRFSLPLLRRCYRRIVQADLDTKTGLYEGELALELLVGDLAGAVSR